MDRVMDDSLRNVLAFAIWGSLITAVVLGSFLLVQAITDPPRRRRFALLSLISGYLVFVDFVQSTAGWERSTYEWLRLWWMAGYAGSVLLLLDAPVRVSGGATLGLIGLGFGTYYGVNPLLATSITFPVGYVIVSAAHARRYLQSRSYASAILSSFSTAQALACASYFKIVSLGSPRGLILGYGQFAAIGITAVLLGWVQLPRELRGRSPVRTPAPMAVALVGSVLLAQGAVIYGLIRLSEGPPVLLLAATACQIGAALVVYFQHRHQLVIHADNVGQLLEERTAALRGAQEELAKRNALQSQLLAEQERALRAKAEHIERQRRLELAAQTAGQAAHDIQNAVTPLLLRLEELERGTSLDQVRESAARMRQQIDRLLDLNGQMLALSRRGRGEFHPVRLKELIAEAADAFPGRPVKTQEGADAWVSGSWAQLFRALSNLIANGLEAAPGGSASVVVRCGTGDSAEARRCHLGFLSPGRHAWLQVEDNGEGIAPEIVDRIFEPFFSSKHGRQKSGSGLGLTIVSAVVDDHRGVLDLETKPGRTCFTLYFPALEPPAESIDASSLSGSATVLVVDDDSSVRLSVTAALERAGYSVLSAEDGFRAIRILQLHDPDVAILDLQMPGMTGLQTYLGAIHLRPNLRVIVHSSGLSPEEIRPFQAAGVTEFLQKPAGRLPLLQAVDHLLKERKRPVAAPQS
jgi:signal transduction histidine kinase/ActR/RegA family two-component response regulator